MSHIRKESKIDISGVTPEMLEEGLKIVGALLEMQGVKVTDYFYNFDSRVSGQSKGVEIVLGLDAEGMSKYGRFSGIGVGIDANGELSFLGVTEVWDGSQANHARQRQLQERVEKLLPAAVVFAARAALARAQGKNCEVRADKERGLVLEVEV